MSLGNVLSVGPMWIGRVMGVGLPTVFGSRVMRVQGQFPDLGPVGTPQVIPAVLRVAMGSKQL